MARWRPSRPRPANVVLSDGPDVAARIAWAYLATLLAGLVTGLLAVVASGLSSALCGTSGDVGECRFGWVLATGLLGIVAVMVPAALLLKLGWYHWCAFLTGYAVLVVTGAIDQWWWWVLAVTLPGLAASASAGYAQGGRTHPVQRWTLIGAAVAAAAWMAWWYAAGQ